MTTDPRAPRSDASERTNHGPSLCGRLKYLGKLATEAVIVFSVDRDGGCGICRGMMVRVDHPLDLTLRIAPPVRCRNSARSPIPIAFPRADLQKLQQSVDPRVDFHRRGLGPAARTPAPQTPPGSPTPPTLARAPDTRHHPTARSVCRAPRLGPSPRPAVPSAGKSRPRPHRPDQSSHRSPARTPSDPSPPVPSHNFPNASSSTFPLVTAGNTSTRRLSSPHASSLTSCRLIPLKAIVCPFPVCPNVRSM